MTFTTLDYGMTWSKTDVPFIPDIVSFDETQENVILIHDTKDKQRKVN